MLKTFIDRTIPALLILAAIVAGLGLALEMREHGPYPKGLPIIPRPVNDRVLNGFFMLSATSRFVVSDAAQRENAATFNAVLQEYYGFSLPIDDARGARAARNTIGLTTTTLPNLPDTAYRLRVDSRRVQISGSATSVWHGLQTLRQLMDPRPARVVHVQAAEVEDYPRYPWRGMHLDVSRHFFGVAEVKRYLDYIAFYKMNVFHWHLTDDQGWRIAITNYPRLTEIGSVRGGTLIGHSRQDKSTVSYSKTEHGGYYTQDEIRDVVAYARRRRITVMPEIEMPGHCMAALAAYPELSCTGGPFEVSKTWEKFDEAFCAKDEVFVFLQNVLDEVIALFPSEYIHVGGDECSAKRWAACQACTAVRAREGITNVAAQQSYFLTRIEKHINARGRKMMGWCEIHEGGLPPNVAVMSWRGFRGGMQAAELGHKVVMTPNSHCYFDFYQDHFQFEPLAIGGFTPMYKVYSFDPVPPEFVGKPAGDLIMGGQGNLWTEYITNWDSLEYMVFPRIAAMAEALWTPLARKDLYHFGHRLADGHFDWLNRMGINFSQVMYNLKVETKPVEEERGLRVTLTNLFLKHPIYYTLDGSAPTPDSRRYRKPFVVNTNMQLRAQMFVGEEPMGREMAQDLTVPAGG